MYPVEKGVLENSVAYFHTPSQVAKSIFFYLICVGHFYCDENYYLKRKAYDSFLLMYIKAGKGLIFSDEQSFSAKAGDVILLNCHKPHSYRTTGSWETLWLHFDGNVSTEYFDLISTRFGCVVPLNDSVIIQERLEQILDDFKNSKIINESLLSCHIQRMLSEIHTISAAYPHDEHDQANPMIKAITYIKNNYNKNISLHDVATHLCMSIYYFSRLFKKSTGYSPYEYITMIRLNRAKYLLKTTELPIKEITFQTGFNSETNFITCFKQHTKYTPSEFRKIPF